MSINELLQQKEELLTLLKYSKKENDIMNVLDKLKMVNIMIENKEMLCQ